MKYYLPLIFISLIAGVRIYNYCLKNICEGKVDSASFLEGTGFGDLLNRVRDKAVDTARKFLPSPHSELVLGMVIGVDDFDKLPAFKEALKRTGTIHVVVVSGFNISLVYGFVVKMLGSKYKIRNVLLALLTTLFYALLSGFNPPVIRSWVMASVASTAKYYGRNVDALRLLVFSALVMLLLNPQFLFNLSFQLSFLATLGLTTYSDSVSKVISKFKIPDMFSESLSSTVAAQVFVWPLISHTFESFSVISFITNTLVLWTVSVSTVFGCLLILLGAFSSLLGNFIVLFLYPLISVFEYLVSFLSGFYFSSIKLTTSIQILVIYYLFVCLAAYLLNRNKKQIYEVK